MENKIRVALIGCGNMCWAGHIPAFQKMDDVEITALCDIVPSKTEWAAKHLDVPADRCFESYEDMLNAGGFDAVDICTPNYLHSIIAAAALNKGYHVFCEKPDAVSVEEAMKMKEAAEKSGKTLMIMRNNRYNNYSVFLKKFINDGKMGEIYTARCGWRRRRGIPGKGGWFTTKAMSGGGPLIDLGVHMIDLCIWLMGNPAPVAVSGCTYCKFADSDTQADSVHAGYGEKMEDGTFDVEDLAMGFIRFDNGACMQIEFSWASNIEQEKYFIDLRGTKAGASTDTKDGKFKIFSEENGHTIDIVPNLPEDSEQHGKNLRHFIDVLEGKAEPDFKPDQGVNMIKILEAMYKSAEEGREIAL